MGGERTRKGRAPDGIGRWVGESDDETGQPQTLDLPPPPQVCPEGHVPHIRMLPQPSPATPQLNPSCAHVNGQHPGKVHCPTCVPLQPPHSIPIGHMPQFRTLPQPSLCMPHMKPCWAQVFEQQAGSPQTPGVPAPHAPGPPQVWPEGHLPHWIVFPQPSSVEPQSRPSSSHVFGVQAQTLGWPLAPQVCPVGQVPQFSMPQQPSLAKPQSKPSSGQVCGVHGGDPQWLGWPLPPQVTQAPPPHAPQLMTWPQPSSATPQS
jgi:hypothetical protein